MEKISRRDEPADPTIDKRERPLRRRDSGLLIQDSGSSKATDPIIGYADEALLPLADACQPLVGIVDDILEYAAIALKNTPAEPPSNLTKDEAASIHLYTMEWANGQTSLYSALNQTLRCGDRNDLKPWFKYMKLFLTGLVKLPCAPSQTVWRGVRRDISADFPPGAQVTWWSFSSCTKSLDVLESDMYLGNVGERTLFSIELINGRIIRNFSYFDTEDEILMLPGTYMEVQSQFTPAPDLHIVHLKQMVPKEVLLQTPFEGACLYPEARCQWYRKKRFALLVAVALAVTILGAVLGARSMNRSPVILSSNVTKIVNNLSTTFILRTLKFGQTYSSTVTGSSNGTIYGTNIYKDDSDLATAAVHAGVLQVGETKNITVRVVSGRASYTASTQHGVSSIWYGSWSRSYTFLNMTSVTDITPANLADYDGKSGIVISYLLTGTTDGRVHGTNIYRDDSDLATAAVHAGFLHVGEVKNITLRIISGRLSYAATTQNGVTSLSYGPWSRSYLFLNTTTAADMVPVSLADYAGKIGGVVCYPLVGTLDGRLYGTSVYTDDSDLATAAVHAGVLRVGETKNITIRIIGGQSSYVASTQNGVTSLSFGSWSRSYLFLNTTVLPHVAPVNFADYEGKMGDIVSYSITGALDGRIYGTNIYTEESDFGTAAVHAGFLKVGDTKNITMRILSGRMWYTASTQNSISSLSYGPWSRSYTFLNTTSVTDTTPVNFADYDGAVGDTFCYPLTGALDGRIYGTNIYTDDSDLATAAVHAGLLHVGETKNITMRIIAGQPSYAASKQHGISSLSYGAWSRSYTFV